MTATRLFVLTNTWNNPKSEIVLVAASTKMFVSSGNSHWPLKMRFQKKVFIGYVLRLYSCPRREQPGLLFFLAIAASVLALGHLREWCCEQLKSGVHSHSWGQVLFLVIKTYLLFLTGLADMFQKSLYSLWFFDVITNLLKLQPHIVAVLQIILKA